MKTTRAAALCLTFALVACGPVGPTDATIQDAELAVPTPGWRLIQAGSFVMGSPASEMCRLASHETPHQVTLTRPFEMAPTEVTQLQFRQVMGYTPAKHNTCGFDCPVENISHAEAAAYCNALSAKAGLDACHDCTGEKEAVTCRSVEAYAAYTGGSFYACPGYRLPTEAEWEYAYRAGSTSALHSGDDVTSCTGADKKVGLVGWYTENAGQTLHRVGEKQPNDWGLSDLAGNIAEWVNDRFKPDLGTSAVVDPEGPSQGDSCSVRGGAWHSYARDLRAAARRGLSPDSRASTIGFRCVRTLRP